MLQLHHTEARPAPTPASDRMRHAVRIQLVARDRRDPFLPTDREGARRLTAARLAADRATR